MSSPFADLLGSHLQRTHTSVNRLAILSGVPQRTIANWFNGHVRKPHQWQSIIKVAVALHLNNAEATELLQAAGYPSLTDLYSSITSPVDRKILRPYYSSLSDSPPAPFQAIADIPTFVGRSAELEELKQVLVNGGRAAIYGLRGMGGVGKTTLAAHLAYQLREKFPDGVLWARLDSSDPLSVLASFAEAFGKDVSQFKDMESRASVVRSLLAEKRVLIVLDNVETSAQVRTLLPPSTGISSVLITTRRDLFITDGWKSLTLEPFSGASDEAIQLFEHYLGVGFVRFHRATLLEIATLLGHLPLALAIAAGLLANKLSRSFGKSNHEINLISNLLSSLRASHTRLDTLTRDDLGVRASFDISYAGLSLVQQHTFSTLGIFSGEDFGSDAVAYLIDSFPDEAEAELRHFQALCLVQENHTERWRLHPLLRDYAREKLETTGRLAPVVEKALLMYRQAVRGGWAFARSLDAEIPNIRFALDEANRLKLHQPLLETVQVLYPTLYRGAWFLLARTALEYAREAASAMSDTKADLHLLNELALIQLGLGDSQSGRENLLLALQLARSADHVKDVFDILSSLGKLEHDTGNRKQANFHLEESLTLARKINDPYMLSRSLNNLAFNSLAEARYMEAREMLLEALEISRAHSNTEAIHRIVMNLGELYWQVGDWKQADAYWKEALPLARRGNYRAAMVALLANIAKVHAYCQKWAEAEQFCEEAIRLGREIKSPRVESIAHGEFGQILYQQKKYTAALSQLNQGIELAVLSGDMERKGIILCYLGLLYLELGQLKEAQTNLGEAMITAKEVGHEILVADIYFVQAKVTSMRKDHSKARHLAAQAGEIYDRFSLSRQSNEVQQWMRSQPKTPQE